ncbi:hypothetical protein KUTeg_011724 [Tegillarca granosa]|uniref:Uncharacterized protein n=1 Tax=Tegillarca granosa TaxID=220873 RepID=A0ABQ9EXG6_TEGGR|nr:hypothetical protein KUTeg_011724 [Tegillarca granosa]
MSNSTETDFLTNAVQVLVPQPCYDEYFHKYNFMHGDCMKIVLSKILGFGIILGSMLVKLPQVIKIARAKSAEGINFFSVLCFTSNDKLQKWQYRSVVSHHCNFTVFRINTQNIYLCSGDR